MKFLKGMPFREWVAHLVYGNDPQLLNSPTRREQSLLTLEALVAVCGLTLIQGNFLQGLLIYWGADDAILSLITISAAIAGAAAMFGGYIFEGRKRRKKIIIAMLLTARLACSLVVFVPLLVPEGSKAAVPIMVTMVMLCNITTSLADTGYNAMLVGLIPIQTRARDFAVRNTMMQIIVPIISIIAALYLDKFGSSYIGYIVVYTIGGMLIILEAVMLSRVREPEYPPANRFRLAQLPKQLKENKPLCIFALQMLLFYVFRFLSASFNTTYLMKYNGFSYTLITIASICLSLGMVVFYKKWGRYSDRVGSGKVLFIAVLLFGAEAISWVIIPPALLKYLFFIPYVLLALASSSFNVSQFARKFELIPSENMTAFIGMLGATTAAATALGSFLGTQLKVFIENSGNEALISGLWQFRLVYLAAAVTITIFTAIIFIKNKAAKI